MESYDIPGCESTHGKSGLLGISAYQTKIGQEFIDLLKTKYDTQETRDLHDFKSVNKVGLWPKFIDSVTGKRSDVAHAYLHSIRKTQNNLQLAVHTKVARILFDGTRAIGVQCIPRYIILLLY
jgi:alcohol oxidase